MFVPTGPLNEKRPRDPPLVSSEKFGKHRINGGTFNQQPSPSTDSHLSGARTPESTAPAESGSCDCCCKSMPYHRRSALRLFLLVVFMVVYLLLGSVVFSELEGTSEDEVRDKLRKKRADFLVNNSCITDAELEDFLVEVIEAANRGVSAIRNVSSEPNWSFGQSLFFAGTILTTIGYGHVTPLSEGGKIFCIVYAAIGIPLTLIMFTALVERLMLLTGHMLQCLCDRLGHLYKLVHIRLIHLCIIVGAVVVFVFLIPAAIFTVVEDEWNYLDSFYYCFISMTTIGLGDYIPGDNPEQAHRPLYKICTTFYLFIGLVLMMLLLANIYDVPELNVGYHFYLRSDQEEGERMRLNASDPPNKYTEQVNKAYSDDTRSADERSQLTNN